MQDRIFVVRVAMLGITGVICAAYGVLAVLMQHPAPFAWWIPAFASLATVVLIWGVATAAGDRAAAQSFDESYLMEERRAQAWAFWTVVWLYPVMGLGLWAGVIRFEVAFAAIGTLMAAVYMLSLVWMDIRGREWTL